MLDTFKIVSLVLVIIGAINWGLFGLFNIDLVALILGSIPVLAKVVYTLVGIGGIVLLVNIKDFIK